MFIHPDVDERIDLIGMDPQSCGLLTALIPARSVCGFESQHQALGKVLRLAVVEGRGHRAEHFGAREHIADYRHAHAQDCPAHGVHSVPVWAALAPLPSTRPNWRKAPASSPASAVDNAAVAAAPFSSSASAVNAR